MNSEWMITGPFPFDKDRHSTAFFDCGPDHTDAIKAMAGKYAGRQGHAEWVFLAVRPGEETPRVVAYSHAYEDAHFGGQVITFNRGGTDLAFQRMGLGTALQRAVVEHLAAGNPGLEKIRLLPDASAEGFFAKLGFKSDAEVMISTGVREFLDITRSRPLRLRPGFKLAAAFPGAAPGG